MSSYASLLSANPLENNLLEDFFEISNQLTFSETIEENCSVPPPSYQLSPFLLGENGNQTNMSGVEEPRKVISDATGNRNHDVLTKSSKGNRTKVAFKTKSDLDILDDGYRWRKYGKKMMKNSPNPRNYYRCSSEGCNVKKRIQRDTEDMKYVITMYEGVHNHHAPNSRENNKAPTSHPLNLFHSGYF